MRIELVDDDEAAWTTLGAAASSAAAVVADLERRAANDTKRRAQGRRRGAVIMVMMGLVKECAAYKNNCNGCQDAKRECEQKSLCVLVSNDENSRMRTTS